MSKKPQELQVEQNENVVEVESQPDALVKAENQTKESKKVNKKEDKQATKKANKKKEKKENFLVRFFKFIGKKIKELVSELKKVSWPSFGKVVKQTGVVIAVVVIFTVVLFGIDRLLAFLFGLLF